jgi:hypothetical protein
VKLIRIYTDNALANSVNDAFPSSLVAGEFRQGDINIIALTWGIELGN